MNLRIAILCNERLALPALAALLAAGRLVAVAMPDRTSETRVVVRGLCAQHHVPLQFFRKQDMRAPLIGWLQQVQPDVVLVKTFPWKIPVAALSLPPHGFINFHYAPLPAWRGPNPLFWMIRNRASMGGVTVHRMDASYDTGPILLQLPVPLLPDMTMGMYCTQLAYTGVDATGLLLQALITGSLTPVPQDLAQAKWYRKPVAADCMIDWNHTPAASVKALVKAGNPWNKGAATSWKGWHFGVTDVTLLPTPTPAIGREVLPGTIVTLDAEHGLQIACYEGGVVRADVIYCEEGLFAGHCLALFGLKKGDQLGAAVSVQKPAVVSGEILL